MIEHTPGPWRVGPNTGDGGVSVVADAPRGHAIGLCYGTGRLDNAHLIAAAPDMLDALLKADAWVAQYHDTPGHDAASRLMSALLRRVIARAEGLS